MVLGRVVFSQHVARRGGVFGWGEYGCAAFSWWERVELFYGGVVAEAVGPPSRDEVHAVSFHAFEELPSTVSRAGQFGGFGGGVYSGVCRVCRG